MLGISFSEILLITIIAIVILGPKQLAAVATKIGLLLFSLKRYFDSIKNDLYNKIGVNEIYQTKNELLDTYQSFKNSIVLDKKITNANFTSIIQSENNLYQPELEFERQPELFDPS